MPEVFAEAVYVATARECLAFIDDAARFVGIDKASVSRRIMKACGLSPSGLNSFRYRVGTPPGRIGHGAYLAICSVMTDLARKALAKAERLLEDAEASGIGLDQELWDAARDLASRADEIENRLAATKARLAQAVEERCDA
jgi:hypothetical protein